MGHYRSEMVDDLAGYYPEELPEVTEANLRHNIARANKAEAELRLIRDDLQALRRLTQRYY